MRELLMLQRVQEARERHLRVCGVPSVLRTRRARLRRLLWHWPPECQGCGHSAPWSPDLHSRILSSCSWQVSSALQLAKLFQLCFLVDD